MIKKMTWLGMTRKKRYPRRARHCLAPTEMIDFVIPRPQAGKTMMLCHPGPGPGICVCCAGLIFSEMHWHMRRLEENRSDQIKQAGGFHVWRVRSDEKILELLGGLEKNE